MMKDDGKYNSKQRIITTLCWIGAFGMLILLFFEFVSFNRVKKYTVEMSTVPEEVTFINAYTPGESTPSADILHCDYVINKQSKKIHKPDCSAALSMAEEKRQYIFKDELEDFYAMGYSPCNYCMNDKK